MKTPTRSSNHLMQATSALKAFFLHNPALAEQSLGMLAAHGHLSAALIQQLAREGKREQPAGRRAAPMMSGRVGTPVVARSATAPVCCA